MEAAKEAQFAANIGVGGDLSNLLSEDNPDGVIMITDEGKITFVNQVQYSMNDIHSSRAILIGVCCGTVPAATLSVLLALLLLQCCACCHAAPCLHGLLLLTYVPDCRKCRACLATLNRSWMARTWQC